MTAAPFTGNHVFLALMPQIDKPRISVEVLRGKAVGMGTRIQRGRELCIPISLQENLALRVSQAAGTTSRIAISFARVIATPVHS